MKTLKIFAALVSFLLVSAAFSARADQSEIPAVVACQSPEMFKEVILAPDEEKAPRAVAQLVSGDCIRFPAVYSVTVNVPPVDQLEHDGHLFLFFEAVPGDPTYQGPQWYVFFATPVQKL